MNRKEIKELNLRYPSLVLLNAEGNILKVFKLGDEKFMLLDEYKEHVGTLSSKLIYDFTRGDLTIVNSIGEELNYMKFPGSMKPDLKELDIFIGVDTEGFSY